MLLERKLLLLVGVGIFATFYHLAFSGTTPNVQLTGIESSPRKPASSLTNVTVTANPSASTRVSSPSLGLFDLFSSAIDIIVPKSKNGSELNKTVTRVPDNSTVSSNSSGILSSLTGAKLKEFMHRISCNSGFLEGYYLVHLRMERILLAY
ncbi:unnamed protein product [Heterobilharzia americana]|nr:unnamed protein product [Heterobilharzia americana]